MKRTMLVGLLAGAVALAGASFAAEQALALGQDPPAPEQAPPAEPEPPAAPEPPMPAGPPSAPGQQAPKDQPDTEPADIAALPTDELDLGSVRIPRAVRANGEPLAAGTYEVRLTPETADAAASPGATPEYERWVEFLSGGEVAGREMASVVPESQIDNVVQGGRPGADSSRVEMLRGGDFLRVWIRRGDANVLIHLLADGGTS